MQNTDTIRVRTTPAEMLHPGSRALFRYWDSIRGEMSAPSRDGLDLKKIHHLLPFVFMIERKRGKSYVWRLAGTRVCELWGMELTGKPALVQSERFESETWARLLDRVIDTHQPFLAHFRLNFATDASLAAESVGLPLTARNGAGTHVFGIMMPFREVRRSRHDQANGFELTAARTLWTERTRKMSAKIAYQGFQVINGGRAG